MKTIAGALGFGAALLLAVPFVAAATIGLPLSAGVSPTASGSSGPAATDADLDGIPAAMVTLYVRASGTCRGLPWTVLAAIGTVESGNGTSTLPGVHSGANPAGAEGPMQFEPDTFARYDLPVAPGGASPPSPYDPTDAVFAAARDLCANGATDGAELPAAVFAYNHDSRYVAHVLALARRYGQDSALDGVLPSAQAAGAAAGALAAQWALGQIGTPYVWGGETPGVGFDCSGLVQAAYAAVGIGLPRVAQSQFDLGPHLAAQTALEPGDLVFFGAGPADVSHVGVFVALVGGRPQMVDAPHTGADVRIDAFVGTVGAPWGGDVYVGATRPSI